jgi:hypothetical protein
VTNRNRWIFGIQKSEASKVQLSALLDPQTRQMIRAITGYQKLAHPRASPVHSDAVGSRWIGAASTRPWLCDTHPPAAQNISVYVGVFEYVLIIKLQKKFSDHEELRVIKQGTITIECVTSSPGILFSRDGT